MKILNLITVYQYKPVYYLLSQSLADQILASLLLSTDWLTHLKMVRSYMTNLVLPETVLTDQECGMTIISNVWILEGKYKSPSFTETHISWIHYVFIHLCCCSMFSIIILFHALQYLVSSFSLLTTTQHNTTQHKTHHNYFPLYPSHRQS